MLCNELKDRLPENWKEKFKHRDLWDPGGYGVASFDLGGDREKVLAINFATEDIMEYFYDDRPDDEWISLDRTIKLCKGIDIDNYKINKQFLILNLKLNTVKNLNEYKSSSHVVYPEIQIKTAKKSYHFRIHRLIATTFIPNINIEKFNLVNHRDSNKDNFSLENLEWCDAKWNNSIENKVDKFSRDSKRVIRESDGAIMTYDEAAKRYGVSKRLVTNQISNSIRKNIKWEDTTWRYFNPVLEDYLSRHPLQDDWYQHPTMSNVRANGCGVLEIDGKLRMGSLHHRGGYYYVSINRRNKMTHRLLAECFFKRILKEDEVVDHIVPRTKDDINNSIGNLRITSQAENMRNPNTRKNLGTTTRVLDISLKKIIVFESGAAAEAALGISATNSNTTLLALDKYIVDGFTYPIEDKLKYIYFKLTPAGEIVKFGNHLGTLTDVEYHDAAKTLYPFLNTGMPAPDGFYYQQGDPWNMIYDPDNNDLIKKRDAIRWIDRNKNREDN